MSARKESPICGECGDPRDTHGHEFRPAMVPATCACDPTGWRNPFDVPEVCASFVDDPEDAGHCQACHHDAECHAASRTVQKVEVRK